MKNRIERRLDSNFEKQIREAIARAEKQTSAEIVPMVVWSSTGSDHVFPLLALILGLSATILFEMIPMDSIYPLMPWHIAVFGVLATAMLSRLLSKVGMVQNLLTSHHEIQRSVEQRALVEFYQAQLDKTVAHTGVLLFLSLRERKAVVLADRSIAEKFEKSVWSEVIKNLVETASRENLTSGLVAGIESCGKLVAEKFPRAANDTNELPNKLIIKD